VNPRDNLTSADRIALATYPQLWRIVELRESGGWFFRPLLVEGRVELLTAARMWPDQWSDAIAIRNLGDARAFRCDPAGGEVWKREGLRREVLWIRVEVGDLRR
jgi:hypothetical protein